MIIITDLHGTLIDEDRNLLKVPNALIKKAEWSYVITNSHDLEKVEKDLSYTTLFGVHVFKEDVYFNADRKDKIEFKQEKVREILKNYSNYNTSDSPVIFMDNNLEIVKAIVAMEIQTVDCSGDIKIIGFHIDKNTGHIIGVY